jgi:hypothetical protein
LQTPRRSHGQPDDLADNGTETTEGQAFLHVRQNVFLLVALDEDHAIRMQADLCERRKEQIRSRQTPDNGSLRPRRDPGSEESGSRPIDGPGSASGELVKSTACKATAW